jgi:hypothetical protein
VLREDLISGGLGGLVIGTADLGRAILLDKLGHLDALTLGQALDLLDNFYRVYDAFKFH